MDNNKPQFFTSMQLDDRTTVKLYLIDKCFITVWLLIRSVVFVIFAYLVFLAVEALAGQQTEANFALNMLADSKSGNFIVVWMPVFVILVIWASGERWLRLRKVAAMSSRIKELEARIDPQRTSSGLTAAGQTPKEWRHHG